MLNKAVEFYDWAMDQGDKRTKHWPLVDCPVLIMVGLVGYLVLLYVIRKVMEHRKPFHLKTFLIVYNLFQVIVSFYISAEVLAVAIESKYDLTCEPVDYSSKPLPLRMASAMWLYYVVKIVDLLDTVLFALRKKHNQITFLHVFHHFSMVCNAWFGIMYVAGGQTFTTVMLNSFVHVVMYFYYALSAIESAKPYLWWKRYLTQLQLVQFAIIVTHAFTGIYNKCSYPMGFSLAFVTYGVLFTILFTSFYLHSYTKKHHHHHSHQHANGHAKNTNGHVKAANGHVKTNGSAKHE